MRSTTILLTIIMLLVVLTVKPTAKTTAQPQVETPARIVGITSARVWSTNQSFVDGQALVRVWSDGFAEYRGSGPYVFPQQWTPLPENPDAPLSSIVGVTGSPEGNDPHRAWFSRQYADGTVDKILLEAGEIPGNPWTLLLVPNTSLGWLPL